MSAARNGKARLTWTDVDIDIPPGATGHAYTMCPKCAPTRTKPSNKNKKTLGVTLDADPPFWGCSHCGKTGSLAKGWTDEDPDWRDGLRSSRRTYQAPAQLPPAVPPIDDAGEAGYKKAWSYFADDRKIPAEILRRHQVTPMFRYMRDAFEGEGGETWVAAFPFFENGKHINTKFRTGKTKYMQMETGARRTWYGYDDVKGKTTVVICEGELDKLSVEAAGYVASTSVPNGTKAVSDLDFSIFDNAKRVIIAVDNDEAGRKLGAELASRFGHDRCFKVIYPVDCKDANDVLMQHGIDALRTCLDNAKYWDVYGLTLISDIRESIIDLYNNGLDGGPSTGWPRLDKLYRPALGLSTTVTGVPGMGKALALDTPIPTPTGWTTMGEIKAGDYVFSEHGKPIRVIDAAPVILGGPCYRVRFAGGDEIVAHADHEWFTVTALDRRHKRFGQVTETWQIAQNLMAYGKRNHAIPNAKPLDIRESETELPIPPYTLGAWLGDGETSNAIITACEMEIIERIRLDGFSVEAIPSDPTRFTIRGVRKHLRELGLLGSKHIPMSYLRGGSSTRRTLLAGLVDTDGHVSSQGTVEIVSVYERLAMDIAELVSTLGYLPSVKKSRAMLNGKDCGPRWRIRFTPSVPVAATQRKIDAFRNGGRIKYRYIDSCEQIDSVPTRCITVKNPTGLFLAGRTMIPTHNSHVLHALLTNLMKGPDEWRIGVCSPEHNPLSLLASIMAAAWIGKPFDERQSLKYNMPRMTLDELNEVLDRMDGHMYFNLPKSPTVDSVLEVARIQRRRFGINGFVIDPWSSLEANRPNFTTESDYVGQCMRQINEFARTESVHVWIVAHPTKLTDFVEAQEKDADGNVIKYLVEPVVEPYHISQSANWYNMSDFILSIWRNKKAIDPKILSKVAVHVKKVRYDHLGSEGECWFDYDGATGRYRDGSGSYGTVYDNQMF